MITKKLEIGQEIPSFKVKMEKKTYKQYNKLAKEINPMHLSKLYVHRLGYDDILIAGNFLFSFIPKWIINWIEGNINALSSITIKFENPVYIDDEIVLKGNILEIRDEEKKKILKNYGAHRQRSMR